MLEYDSSNRPPPVIDEFFQLVRYRDLIFLMVGNILKNRYKRSVLGVFWMLLNPLLQTIVLTIAFGTMFKSSLPDYAVYLLCGLLAWNFITSAWLFLPVSILILMAFTLGFALLLSTASVFFTDTIDIYQVLVQALFFLTPIMYPPSIFPTNLNQLLTLNPFMILIEIFRIPIYANQLPDLSLITNAASLSFITLITGWILFTSKADQLAYRL